MSTVSTQSTPHPRAKIIPAGRAPCELGWELRDQAPRTTNSTVTVQHQRAIPNLNPVCIPHIGTRLVRRASEEEEKYDDDADSDRTRRGDTVDAFGFTVTVSARLLVQH